MSDPPPPPPDPRVLLKSRGLRAKKSWGQNFLNDQGVLRNIAEVSRAGPGDHVVELGAGLGALTYHLLLTGAQIIAVERDRDLVPLLREIFQEASNLSVLEADAAKLSFGDIAASLETTQGTKPSLTVVGNLPYQLSGRILVRVADAQQDVLRAVLMIQKEVAERVSAEAGSRRFGLLSVLVQRNFDVQSHGLVPPQAFHPRPKVDSMVISLSRSRRRLDAVADLHFVRTARMAFAQKRKTLRNTLAAGLQVSGTEVAAILTGEQIDPSRRAETLCYEEWLRLSTALAQQGWLP